MGSLALFIDRILQGVCALLMIGLAAMVIIAVALRTIGQSPLWYDEVAAIWLVWLTFFAAALVTLRRVHLGFDAALKAMPPLLRGFCFVGGEMIALAFYAAVAFYGWRVLDIIAGETLVSLPWLGYEIVQSVIPVSAAIMLVGQLLSAPLAWRQLSA